MDAPVSAGWALPGAGHWNRVRADSGLHLFPCPRGGHRRNRPAMKLESRAPSGPLADKWDRHRFEAKLVNPANRRRHSVIIVGTGLAGASAASSLGELGYRVSS